MINFESIGRLGVKYKFLFTIIIPLKLYATGEHNINKTDRIKQCGACLKWITLGDILNNPDISPIGMNATGKNHDAVFLYFQHNVDECHSSFILNAEDIAPLIKEVIPNCNLHASDKCEGYCVNLNDKSACQTDCRNAPYRRFILELVENRQNFTAPKSINE